MSKTTQTILQTKNNLMYLQDSKYWNIKVVAFGWEQFLYSH